ncbi:MAG TPA: sugar ABC transporter permease [Nitrososphaerales archaeon]|nr:sugar ABC transporter permease [Nitrososphaerales archaeon]
MDRTAYFLIVPLIAVLAFVEVYPLAYSVYLSVTDYSLGGAFVGLSNYAELFSQLDFWAALWTSVLYSSGSTVLSIVLGLLFAYLLTLVKKGRGYFEAVFLMPLAAAPIIAGVVFAPSAVWDDINTFWHFQLRQPYFSVTSYHLYFPIMVLSDAWEWGPMMMLVALTILASVPKQVYEASETFGASKWKTFRSVGLPAILNSPVMHFMLIIRFVDAMRAFEIPFAWAGWLNYLYPGAGTDTLSLYLFKLLLEPPSGVIPIPLISAAALVLLLVTLLATTLLFRLMKGLRKI